jgi:hypothetical protein
MINIGKYKPAVSKTILIFLAGLVWICAGIMLLYLALSWLISASRNNMFLFIGAGVFLALVIHHFGFLKIVNKNLGRILPMDEKKCLFSFITWKSYLLIVIMVAFGIILRHSVISKQYLAIVYIGIGSALILSSVRYMRVFSRETRKQKLAQ